MAFGLINSLRSRSVWSRETPENQDLSQSWLLQFTQTYGTLDRVMKRGLNATPMVISKYGLGTAEYLVLTSVESRHRASCVFHFAPSVADENRRRIMEGDDSGFEALVSARNEKASPLADGWDNLLEKGEQVRQRSQGRLYGRASQAMASLVGLLGMGLR